MGRSTPKNARKRNGNNTPTAVEVDDDGFEIPLMRPSEIIAQANAQAKATSSKKKYTNSVPDAVEPLVQLGLEDLRAAGVKFTEINDDDEVEGPEEVEVDPDMEDRDLEMEAWWDEFFDSLLLTVPFSFLYLMLDILTNLSYQRNPTYSYFAKNFAVSAPTIGVLVFYSSRHANNELCRLIMVIASALSGTRLMWLVNKASYTTVIAQGPAVGTIWILTIVQLPLLRAMAALAVVFAWGHYRKLKLVPAY